MQIFYAPDIESTLVLPEEESGHCVRAMRLAEGDEIMITDGKGNFYRASITNAHPKHCQVEITSSWQPENRGTLTYISLSLQRKTWAGWNGLLKRRQK